MPGFCWTNKISRPLAKIAVSLSCALCLVMVGVPNLLNGRTASGHESVLQSSWNEEMDVYNSRGELLPVKFSSQVVHEEGLYTHSVMLFICRRAAAGAPELLLQWRSAQKWVFGGMWETAGEHLLSGGESWQQGARRGLSEELGVVIPDPEQPGNEAALAAVGWRQLTATHLSCFTAFHPKLPPDIELRPDGKATASNRDAIDQRNSTYLACRCCSAAPCFGL
eukprot:TRINITY_DN4160_c0_g1_i1.p1 TRINITY_DN4160_c0_g1~~TRINITY_DN4160_c0_g1_i1.p1  ORF type:complete len:223 (+),score=29.21 TRINITY_DN4160_c0_g1_i1:758-1426(+)